VAHEKNKMREKITFEGNILTKRISYDLTLRKLSAALNVALEGIVVIIKN
jgi:hypothetical protein